ncbi:hypothetical protein BGZ63DRAFT_429109 [Mariannaea sp. PMI_226]|nr:hypothetical protein BGZ63DRAFT_429109 [Mariannaea sp. PMI_226]
MPFWSLGRRRRNRRRDRGRDETTHIRRDHTHWACIRELPNDPDTTCLAGTALAYRNCNACGRRRKVGTEAINIDGDTIGYLSRISRRRNGDEIEYWVYNVAMPTDLP